jgi:hypothetical protein
MKTKQKTKERKRVRTDKEKVVRKPRNVKREIELTDEDIIDELAYSELEDDEENLLGY